MQSKVKLALNKFQWTSLTQIFQKVVELHPIESYELESCLIAEMYKRKLVAFTYFKPNKQKKMAMSFSLPEAFAINNLLGDHNSFYQVYIRMELEGQLPAAKKGMATNNQYD